jgi:DNA polymerase-3 subunit gamma/tau
LSHTALARKYRPRRFADVAVQEHVSETLRRAVAGNRVGHAYLFCGPRGVGKTTLARVLAMALNCPDRTAEGEPCGVCDSCSRIWGGHTALDVVEIDAASNRGVDDARDLRERAMYAPSEEGRYKVYIVDEAHMLTREAWNALLKILEEPPPRVIFVFATTEPQKIQQSAAPILSRCQRFDFRRIGVSDIVERLTTVLLAEGAAAPEDALRIIARKADGGMRDALSLLDQVLALTGGEIDHEAVRRVLGLVEDERYLELLDILAEGRHGDVFTLVENLLDEGYDLIEFYHGLMDVLRTVLRLKLSPEADLDLKEELRNGLSARAAAFTAADLVRMLSTSAELEANGSLRRSASPRVMLEMLLLRLSYLDRTVDLEELIRALGGAPSGPPAGVSGGAGTGPSGSTNPTGGDAPPRTENTLSQEEQPKLDLAAGKGDRGASPATSREPPRGRQSGDPEAVVPSATAAEAWNRWLDAGEGVPKGMMAFLRAARVRDLGGQVEIEPPAGPAVEKLSDPVVVGQLREGLDRYLGRHPELVIKAPPSEPDSGTRITEEEVRDDTLKALYRKEPRLERAVQELDLELME